MPTPQRNTVPVRWQPKGCSDAVDGTNAPPGSMAALVNLIPDPQTRDVWVPRPAALELTDFTGANAPVPAGPISGRIIVGDVEYGLIPSTLSAGFDQPYAYDLVNRVFLAVGGVTSANVPTTPPATGDWTPPILAFVFNRVIVTHPGFPGGLIKFGWFDVSGASIGTVGDTINTVPIIVGYPNILGFQPGMAVTGSGIPANIDAVSAVGPLTNAGFMVGTTVAGSPFITITTNYGVVSVAGAPVYCSAFPAGTTCATNTIGATLQLTQNALSTGTVLAIVDMDAAGPVMFQGDTHGNTTIDSIVNGTTANIFVGMPITDTLGTSIPPGTMVTAINSATSITISQAALTTATIHFNVAGNFIELSQAATATANGTSITIAGGTRTAPLWGAGDTARNPLPSVPLGVAQMNRRAWYALGLNGVVFSDSLLPCVVTNSLGVQALTPADGAAITSLGPLLLGVPLTGGIVEGLIAFQGVTSMQQIVGDQSTGNLTMNLLPVATGTAAPLSITPSELGLSFVSPEGLRIIGFNGTVSPPVGEGGEGIVSPFQFAVYPSRICAAANGGVLRITVQNGDVVGAPFQEWWFDLRRKVFHGPHSFPARLIQPWRNTFVTAPLAVDASLWQSDWFANNASGYVENGSPLSWSAETTLLPDNSQIVMNAMVEGSIAIAADVFVNVSVLDEDGDVLDSVSLPTGDLNFRQLPLYWHKPIVFKQMQFAASGQSDDTVRLGNFYFRYEILGYNSPIVAAAPGYLLADDGVTILSDNAGTTLLTPG